MIRAITILLTAAALTGCAGPALVDPPTATSSSTTPIPSASTLTPQQRASILAAAGIPDDPDPATKAAYIRDLGAIDEDIVHGKVEKAVSRGKSTCQSIHEGLDRTKLVDMIRRRFTSPTHPEGRSSKTAARILDVVHERLCPTFDVSVARVVTTSRVSHGTTSTSVRTAVHAGSYCAPDGATGVTAKGTQMVCSAKPGESRARWRAA